MSFWPLPTNLADALVTAGRSGPFVELGSGDGGFSRRLRSLGLSPIQLDRRRPAHGIASRAVRAELACLPFAPGSISGFVLANTLRHVPERQRKMVSAEIHAATRTGGCVAVLEDEPQGRTPAEENYRRALGLLAEVDATRGPTVSRADCARSWQEQWGPVVMAGVGRNEERVEDPFVPLRWLRAHARAGALARAIDELWAGVERSGMEYGDFWFCVFAKGRVHP